MCSGVDMDEKRQSTGSTCCIAHLANAVPARANRPPMKTIPATRADDYRDATIAPSFISRNPADAVGFATAHGKKHWHRLVRHAFTRATINSFAPEWLEQGADNYDRRIGRIAATARREIIAGRLRDPLYWHAHQTRPHRPARGDLRARIWITPVILAEWTADPAGSCRDSDHAVFS